MLVWHVMQEVKPGHNTSYKTGRNWIESHDDSGCAKLKAELMNFRKSDQCIGVRYFVTGPVSETVPPE